MAPSAFRTLRPGSLSPLLLTCEHASDRLPPGFPRDPASRRILKTHWACDWGAWGLARGLAAELEAGAVGARWSRLVIDLNRQVGDPDLVRTEAEGVELPWNHDLAPDEVERRVLEYHVPYHGEIDRLVVHRLVRGVRPFLLSVHTFTPVLGRSRRNFEAGVLYDNHRWLARLLAGGLRDQGLRVRYNEPYSGLLGMMYAADRHGSHHRIPCLELEINQANLADGKSVRAMTKAVAGALRPVLSAVTAS
jgi:predicted N-formylglutamate amidohydrolase